MSWNAIGALAELFGAVGVILTLVFLAMQIRQNTRAVCASANHALNEQRTAINLRFGLDPAEPRRFSNLTSGLGTPC